MSTTGLHAEIDRLAAVGLPADPAVLGEAAMEIERAIRRLEAERSRWLAAFDAAEGFLDEGLTSTKAWLRGQTTASPGQAAAQQAVAGIHGRLPLLFAAWHAGTTTFEHLRHVEVNLRKLPDELWAEVDAELTGKAKTLTASEFGQWLRELAANLGGEPKPKDETQFEARRLSLQVGFQGMTNVSGRLTPEVAEKLRAALSAASRPDGEGELRLPNQRSADALEYVLDRVLAAGSLPSEGGERPQLRITVDLDLIGEQAQREQEAQTSPVDWTALSDEQRAARVAAALAATDAATDPASGRPAYYWTGPASVAAARRLACDATVLPIFTRNGAPLDVGRTTRMISAPLRALIEGRDRHCQWKNCQVSARWCEVHHLKHWKDGGTTDRWNLVLLCPHHHKAAHDGRFTVFVHAPGIISTRRRRRPDDPYYVILLSAPPEPFTLTDKLHAAAARAARAGHP